MELYFIAGCLVLIGMGAGALLVARDMTLPYRTQRAEFLNMEQNTYNYD
jgi:hypothetical protein